MLRKPERQREGERGGHLSFNCPLRSASHPAGKGGGEENETEKLIVTQEKERCD